MIVTKTYAEPLFCEKEILRYAGCKGSDNEILPLVRSCISEIRDSLVYKICYRELEMQTSQDICDFGSFSLKSKDLAKNLKGSRSIIIFAATIGIEIDRLIAKYGRISPSKALMFQAIGAERIEALCDAFCQDIQNQKMLGASPRFSPGYGDLALDAQKDIFNVLQCSKQIGLFLNDSLLMSPSKSVTAFLGLGSSTKSPNKCNNCKKTDCIFRGEL